MRLRLTLLPQRMRAPGKRHHQQRADQLVRHRDPQRNPRQHGGDAEQDLRAEGGMNRERGASIERLHPSRHHHQRDHRRPGPPAVEEMQQEGIVRQCPEKPARRIVFGHEPVLHQRPAVGSMARVEPGDPGAQQ